MYEYKQGRKDLAEEIIKELEDDIDVYSAYEDYSRVAEANYIKQYIQDLIKE